MLPSFELCVSPYMLRMCHLQDICTHTFLDSKLRKRAVAIWCPGAAQASPDGSAGLDGGLEDGKTGTAPDRAPPSELRYMAALRAQLARSLIRLLALAEPGAASRGCTGAEEMDGGLCQCAAVAHRFESVLHGVVLEAGQAGAEGSDVQAARRGLAELLDSALTL